MILETKNGQIQGIEENGYQRFAGIRYARAGRWEYPVLENAWDGIYDATAFGAACFQNRALKPETEDNFYYVEFRKNEFYEYSEDCFFLNIWKPKDCENAPIIFYIHGGAFQGGCGNEKHFDGEAYAKKGVIFITINYSLGVLGFCSLPELQERDGHTGNYGLYDQMMAFEWVRKNIADFGGDPDNITMMGQSAGAMSVQLHCVSPFVKKQIAKAIMTSGGGLPEKFGKYYTVEETFDFWKKVFAPLGDTLEDWTQTDLKTLFEATAKVAWTTENGLQYLMPVKDDCYIIYDANEIRTCKEQANIPYIMGSTKDDLIPVVLDEMAKEWCVLQSEEGMVPSYCFRFERNLPGDDKGAWHSSELWYTIGNLKNCWRPMTSWDEQISNKLVSYFSNFSKTGDPNGEGLPIWDTTRSEEDAILVVDDQTIAMRKTSLCK